jgi:hypothetical protein
VKVKSVALFEENTVSTVFPRSIRKCNSPEEVNVRKDDGRSLEVLQREFSHGKPGGLDRLALGSSKLWDSLLNRSVEIRVSIPLIVGFACI